MRRNHDFVFRRKGRVHLNQPLGVGGGGGVGFGQGGGVGGGGGGKAG